MTYLTLAITILTTVFGQISIKKGMIIVGLLPNTFREKIIFLFSSVLLNPYIIIGLILSVITTFSWIITVSKSELSFVYPFMSLAFPLVIILSSLFFNEIISAQRWIGLGIIMLGLIIVAKS
jgi:drug/metabolite transporter (DMT)-like permease